MAIDIEHLRHFQTEQLEQKNIQTSARIPIHTRTTEWALIEIVILLTGMVKVSSGWPIDHSAACSTKPFHLVRHSSRSLHYGLNAPLTASQTLVSGVACETGRRRVYLVGSWDWACLRAVRRAVAAGTLMSGWMPVASQSDLEYGLTARLSGMAMP